MVSKRHANYTSVSVCSCEYARNIRLVMDAISSALYEAAWVALATTLHRARKHRRLVKAPQQLRCERNERLRGGRKFTLGMMQE
jgi:hypothetical protein